MVEMAGHAAGGARMATVGPHHGHGSSQGSSFNSTTACPQTTPSSSPRPGHLSSCKCAAGNRRRQGSTHACITYRHRRPWGHVCCDAYSRSAHPETHTPPRDSSWCRRRAGAALPGAAPQRLGRRTPITPRQIFLCVVPNQREGTCLHAKGSPSRGCCGAKLGRVSARSPGHPAASEGGRDRAGEENPVPTKGERARWPCSRPCLQVVDGQRQPAPSQPCRHAHLPQEGPHSAQYPSSPKDPALQWSGCLRTWNTLVHQALSRWAEP